MIAPSYVPQGDQRIAMSAGFTPSCVLFVIGAILFVWAFYGFDAAQRHSVYGRELILTRHIISRVPHFGSGKLYGQLYAYS